MPRLVQKENGDYCIRAYSHSKDGIDTWQVRDLGLTYLERKGVYAGKTFPAWQLQEMIESNWVFIGGSGTHSRNAVIQNRPIISATTSAKNPPITKNSFQMIRARSPQKSKSNMLQAVTQSSHPVRKTTSLVFRKYKKRWELLIVFPKLHVDASKSPLTNGYSLTVVGSSKVLKANQLQSVHSEASISVSPQERDYKLKLVGPNPPCNDLRSLLEESGISLDDVKGLDTLGTVFKKNGEALPLNEGLRMDEHDPLLLGESYYLVFNTDCEPEWVPRTLEVKILGNIGVWEAWEIQLPKKTDTNLSSWCLDIGHAL